MRICVKIAVLGVAIGILAASAVQAGPIDLNSYITDNSLDFPSAGQPAGSWTVSGGGTTVFQSVNGDPTFFVSPSDLTNTTISGTFLEAQGDDDFVGFVFGFQSTGATYVFDWKQGEQFYDGQTALRGISLKRIDATPTTMGDLWSTATVPGKVTNLFYQDVARTDGVQYTFNLTFTTPVIKIKLLQGATELANFTVNDGTYTTGKFGFYNFSQAQVTYSGFTADPAPPASVPVPAALPLGLLGLGCLCAVSRIKRRRASR